MSSHTTDKTARNGFLANALTAYLVTGLAFVVASYFTDGHVWGFNLLAFYPGIVRLLAMPIVLLIVPAAGVYLARRLAKPEKPATASHQFMWIVVGIIAVSVILFYLFRTTTHFDGDGYQALSNLASGAAWLKPADFGAVALQLGIYSLLGKGGEPASLLSYQIVSYTAGVLFLLAVAVMAATQFERLRERMLFFLGMAVGGYSAQFFGYVENYGLFIASIAVYLMVGLLILKGRAARWIIIVANMLAVSLHVFGLILLPATVFILVRETRIADWWKKQEVLLKAAAGLVCLLAAAGVYFYISNVSYFYRFAFLPLFTNQFTASGYTIFSSGHLLDIVNLMFLLCPGLLILIVSILSGGKSLRMESSLTIFVGLVFLCSLAAVLVLDPKLSMPRDWDLFAFSGVSLSMLAYLLAIGSVGKKGRYRHVAGILAVAIGAIFLSSAVANRTHDEIAVARLRSTIRLDPVRNRNSGYFISLDYLQKGDTAKAMEARRVWKSTLLDDSLSTNANILLHSKNPAEGVAALRRILKINPWHSGSYNSLSEYFLQRGELDSARECLRTAVGLQPGFGIYWNNLGWVEMKLGDDKEAEKCFLTAVDRDSMFADPLLYLLDLYRQQNRADEYLNCLIKLAKCPGVPLQRLYELTLYYCQQSDWREAREILARAVANNLDSAHYKQITGQFPALIDTSNSGGQTKTGSE